MIETSIAKTRNYQRIVIGGEPSIGKTTAAITWAPKAYWFDLDNRIPDELADQCLVPKEEMRDFNDIINNLSDIRKEESFDFPAIVVDTITILESIARKHSVEIDFGGNEANYSSYSTGDKNQLLSHVNKILSQLDQIAKKFSIDIILICHSEIKPAKNPNGENYDKAQLMLVDKVRSRIMQWADLVGFAWNNVTTEKIGLKSTAKSGERMISFDNNPRFDAKGPSTVSAQVPFDVEGKWMDEVKKSLTKTTTPTIEKEKVNVKRIR